MNPINSIKVKCRNCNREAPADQYKLHYQLKLMVCPDCFSGKNQSPSLKNTVEDKKIVLEGPPRPAGWDKDDEYLERISRMKRDEQQAQFVKIPNSDFVKCICASCKFSFRHDPIRKQPRACPYCNTEVPRVKTFNLE